MNLGGLEGSVTTLGGRVKFSGKAAGLARRAVYAVSHCTGPITDPYAHTKKADHGRVAPLCACGVKSIKKKCFLDFVPGMYA